MDHQHLRGVFGWLGVSMLPDLWKKKTPTLTRVDSLVGRRGIGPCKDHLDHISVASGGFHFRWLPYPPGNGERKPIPPKRGSWENHRFKGFPSCYMILVGLNFNPIFSHFFFKAQLHSFSSPHPDASTPRWPLFGGRTADFGRSRLSRWSFAAIWYKSSKYAS